MRLKWNVYLGEDPEILVGTTESFEYISNLVKDEPESVKEKRRSLVYKHHLLDNSHRVSLRLVEDKSTISKMRKYGPKKQKVSSKTEDYKLVTIERSGIRKQIHQNQTSAYKKCGWILIET